MEAAYISGLILGLSASFHCLGMCGPLVMAVPIKSNSTSGKVWGITQYHIGKTFTYAVLGLLVGLIGISIQTFRWMQVLSIVSGVLIILFAWGKFIKIPVGQTLVQKFMRFSSKAIKYIFNSNIPLKPMFFGMLNGLLPCGLIYIALINSLLVSSPFQSMLAMVFFGLGTVPILTLVKFVSTQIKWKTNRLMPVLITVVGLMIIFRGLNLGIPYLSPKIELNLADNSKENELSVSCCSSTEKCESDTLHK